MLLLACILPIGYKTFKKVLPRVTVKGNPEVNQYKYDNFLATTLDA